MIMNMFMSIGLILMLLMIVMCALEREIQVWVTATTVKVGT